VTTGDTLLERGQRAYDANDYDIAITHYTHALAQQPDDALLYESRGFAFLEQREYRSAISDFQQVLRLDPGAIDAYYGLAEAT
jgi:tetratricopeptide (TPR) repeat protein